MEEGVGGKGRFALLVHSPPSQPSTLKVAFDLALLLFVFTNSLNFLAHDSF